MKKLVISTLLALLLTTLSYGLGNAQTFAGLSWEGNAGLVIGGKVIPISEKISTFGYVRVTLDSGSYENGLKTQHAVALKLTYHLIDKLNQDLYLVGGESCDWTNIDATKSLNAYLTEAVGAIFTSRVSFLDHIPILNTIFENPELWLSLEFRPQIFDKDTRWQDKAVVGFGVKSGI